MSFISELFFLTENLYFNFNCDSSNQFKANYVKYIIFGKFSKHALWYNELKVKWFIM